MIIIIITSTLCTSGRDCIGLAKTGSGKTFSYIWPMVVHIINQPQMQAGDGPIGIILAPTRELVQQILNEIKKFYFLFQIRVVAVYGGMNIKIIKIMYIYICIYLFIIVIIFSVIIIITITIIIIIIIILITIF
jgi:replicative superfamily II helicase